VATVIPATIAVEKFASHLPTARRRGMLGGMAKPLAKLVALLKPKRRWAQFSLATMFVVVTVLGVWLPLANRLLHPAFLHQTAGRWQIRTKPLRPQ
jgi:hypothetical protein